MFNWKTATPEEFVRQRDKLEDKIQEQTNRRERYELRLMRTDRLRTKLIDDLNELKREAKFRFQITL